MFLRVIQFDHQSIISSAFISLIKAFVHNKSQAGFNLKTILKLRFVLPSLPLGPAASELLLN